MTIEIVNVTINTPVVEVVNVSVNPSGVQTVTVSVDDTATNTADIAALDGRLTTAEADIVALETAVTATAWTAISLGTGWSNYGGGWQVAQYRKVNGIVYLRGLVKRSAVSNISLVTLPVGYRPPAPVMFPVMANYAGGYNVALRITIQSTGDVELDNSNPHPTTGAVGSGAIAYLDLSSISFSTVA